MRFVNAYTFLRVYYRPVRSINFHVMMTMMMMMIIIIIIIITVKAVIHSYVATQMEQTGRS